MGDNNLVDACDLNEETVSSYVDTDGQQRIITLVSVPKIIEERYRVMITLHKLNARLERALEYEDYAVVRRIHTRIGNIRKKYESERSEK